MAGRLKRAGFRAGVIQAAVAARPQALDFSSARLDPAAIRAAGLVGVIRYQWLGPGLRPDFNRAKAITKPEYTSYRNAGLAVALVAQLDKEDWKGGYAHGLELGRASLLHSREMGHPDSAAIPLAVQDASIPTTGFSLAVELLRGYVDGRGLGPQAMYGGTSIGNLCVQAGLAKWIWKAAASSWSPVPSAHIAITQLTSKSYPQFSPLAYDENDVATDWGQNPRPGGDPSSICIFGYPCPWHH